MLGEWSAGGTGAPADKPARARCLGSRVRQSNAPRRHEPVRSTDDSSSAPGRPTFALPPG